MGEGRQALRWQAELITFVQRPGALACPKSCAPSHVPQVMCPKSCAPSHAAQDVVALYKMMAERADDMDEHDRGKHIGKDQVRLLDPLTHRPIHARDNRRDV